MNKLKRTCYALTFSAIAWCLLIPSLMAQDTIKARNGDIFVVQVEEIGVDAVRFKYFDDLEGPYRNLPHSELYSIHFQNGSGYIFSKPVSLKQFSIGQYHEGGYIFHLDSDGQHGLIAAPEPIQGIYSWGRAQMRLGASNRYDGRPNTQAIVNLGKEGSAAHQCRYLNVGGYNDWYLPAIKELERLYENQDQIPYFKKLQRSGQRKMAFCSSTEHVNRNDCMIIVDFLGLGRTKFYNKRAQYHVYPIRKF